jgi:hypothetical protein
MAGLAAVVVGLGGVSSSLVISSSSDSSVSESESPACLKKRDMMRAEIIMISNTTLAMLSKI